MAYCCWILLIIAIHLQAFETLAFHRQKRIVKGEEARIEDFRYKVSVQAGGNNKHFCGGIIISEKNVLTAAHCVHKLEPDDFKIVAGTDEIAEPYFKTDVTDIRVHKNYNHSDSWINDLAILTIEDGFIFDHKIAPAKLPKENYEIPEDTEVIVIGFGRISISSFNSKVLNLAVIETKNMTYCNEKYERGDYYFRDKQICAYSREHRGICKGDSGGPLIYEDKVVGISSFTNDGCSDSGYPSVFVKISKYISWIKKYSEYTDCNE